MTAEQRHPHAVVRGRRAFREWRSARPFWAGLFTILAAGPILWAPYASVSAGDVTVRLTQFGGVSALFIGAILIMCGIALWLTPAARIYLGIFVIIVSLVSFIVATFGGFGVGMLFGLVGGMLATSWTYDESSDDEHDERSGDDDRGDGHDGRADSDDTLVEDGFPADVSSGKAPDASGEASTGSETDRPGDTAAGTAAPRVTLAVIVAAMAGVVGLVGIASASPGDSLPENPYADGPCASASPTASAGSASAAPSASSAAPSITAAASAGSTPAGKAARTQSAAGQPTAARNPTADAKAGTSKSPESTAPASGEPAFKLPELKLPELRLPELTLPGLPGLGLPGIKPPSTASSAPASTVPAAPVPPVAPLAASGGSASATPPAAAASTPSASASGKPSTKPTTTSAKPSATSSSAAPKDGKPPFPCPVQGPVNAKSGNGIPPVAVDPLVLKSSLLAMAGLNYEGVVKVETLAGVEENALKFTVSKGIDIWNMSMTVKEAGGKDVVISSDEGSKSWMDADIPTTMYVKYLKGNIFGIIPITFTPESPPPINVPVVFFTNVESSMYAQLGGKLHIPGYGINKVNVK
ncbi:DUF6114 domain-containing protein [Embleya hyalina]|uniref:Uncharacterized protein n=1 Tax=Embleya hyalina TaxID=516124 RepID=A0A401YKH8_9ACTN|nr:DUF6114 domain-containing protein [Embleya hyalina]GCD95110.1 hypothetical protein EHYA_02779 [Embleya hyalina]